MVINFLIRRGCKMQLELEFKDAERVTTCSHCKVNGFLVRYEMGDLELSCRVEDNTLSSKRRELIEWFLN